MLLLAPEHARAQPVDTGTTASATDSKAEAVAAFKEARVHYRAADYAGALAGFERAYALHPTAAITFNIARCHEKLGQWAEATEAYRRFGEESTDPQDQAEALERIELLKSKLPKDVDSAEARYQAHLEAGKQAYAAGEYERALSNFRRAYELSKSSGLLYNIGKVYERMARYKDAILQYQRYLDDAGDPADRKDVEENIKRLEASLRSRFQELTVSSAPRSADIYLDDRNGAIIGQTNARFKVKPGKHTIYLDLNGYEQVERTFVMPDDKPLALDFALEEIKNVGFVTVRVNVDGARIFIDGAIVGLSPYAQTKALSAGEHQVTIEARGYPRYNADFIVAKDQTSPIEVELEKWVEPVSDDTLSAWGQNLLIIGIIGGTLGFTGPIVYQEVFVSRPYNEAIGPSDVQFGDGVAAGRSVYWRGNRSASGATLDEGQYTPSYRDNGRVGTLKTIQLASAITGGTLALAGLSIYIYKWARPGPRTDIVATDAESTDGFDLSTVRFGVSPTRDGAAVGIVGSF